MESKLSEYYSPLTKETLRKVIDRLISSQDEYNKEDVIIKDWVATLRNKYKQFTSTASPTTEKEIADLLDRADRFDKLMAEPGWEDVCRFMVNEVQREIITAAQYEDQPAISNIYVNRWNAKRSLVDSMMGMIDDCCKERDRLVAQFKKE